MNIRLLNLGLRSLTLIVKFVFILSLAVFLPPEQVGLYGLIAVSVAYSIYFVGFEFYTYSTRDLVARPRKEWSGLLSSQMIFFMIMYLLILPAFSILFFLGMLPWPFFKAFLVLVVLEHLSTELVRLLIAIERPLLATTMIFIKQALWAIFFTIAMWVDSSYRNIETLLLFWMFGVTVSIMIGVRPLLGLNWKNGIKNIDFQWVKRGISIAIPLLVSSIAVKSLFTFDRYAFEALNSLSLLGAYSVYIGVASAMISFMESGVFVFYYPKMMKAYRENKLLEYEVAYQTLRKQSLIWLIVLLIGAAASGAVIFPHLEEQVYADNLSLFWAIVVAVAIFVFGYIFQYGLYTTSRDKSIIFSNVVGLLSAALVLLFVAQYSSYWAVTVAMIVGCAISTGLKYWRWTGVRRHLRLVNV
jgi:O-antigen/teichoic acid export membrane protein